MTLFASAAPEINANVVPPSDFSQIPVQPSHHIANVQGRPALVQFLHSASYPTPGNAQDPGFSGDTFHFTHRHLPYDSSIRINM